MKRSKIRIDIKKDFDENSNKDRVRTLSAFDTSPLFLILFTKENSDSLFLYDSDLNLSLEFSDNSAVNQTIFREVFLKEKLCQYVTLRTKDNLKRPLYIDLNEGIISSPHFKKCIKYLNKNKKQITLRISKDLADRLKSIINRDDIKTLQ